MNSRKIHLPGITSGAVRKSLLTVSIVALLSACGGGNDSSTSMSSNDSGNNGSISASPTPDDAAKILAIALQALLANSPAEQKYFDTSSSGTSNCTDSGTITITDSENNDAYSSAVSFDQCLESDTYIDGAFKVESTSNQTTYTYGTNSSDGALLTEDRGNAKIRTLLSGTSSIKEIGQGDQHDHEAITNINGRIERLAKSMGQGFDLRDLRSIIKDVEAPVSDTTFTGNYSFNGDCITEAGTISTPTAIKLNDKSEFTGGQVSISTSKGNATLTFNSDASVKIDASGGSKTYTKEQIQQICGI